MTNWAIREAMRPAPESTPKAVARIPRGKLSVLSASREFHPEVAHALKATARRTMACVVTGEETQAGGVQVEVAKRTQAA